MNRPKRRSAPGSPEQWLEFAESDLALARLASELKTIRAEHVCFHAQQAAEKAIKAVLRARGLDPRSLTIENFCSDWPSGPEWTFPSQ